MLVGRMVLWDLLGFFGEWKNIFAGEKKIQSDKIFLNTLVKIN
jgi:hypothetical protein